MPLYDETGLKKYIKEPKNINVFLIYGEDDYLKDYYSALLRDKAVDPAFSAFNLHEYEAEEPDFSAVWDAANAYPLMSERTCIFIKGLKLSSLNKEAIGDLKKLIAEIPEFCTLIVKAVESSEDERKNETVKDLIGAISKVGIAARLEKRRSSSLINLIENGAKSRGSSISKDDAMYLVDTVGDDLLVLMNELTKLAAFAGKEGITREIIDSVAVKSVEASIFDLSAAIIENNADKAFSILSVLKQERVSPQIIIGTLASYYADLYRAKVALKHDRRINEIVTVYDYNNKSFRLEKALRTVRNMGMRSIREAVTQLAEADVKIKSTGADNYIVIDSLIASLLNTLSA